MEHGRHGTGDEARRAKKRAQWKRQDDSPSKVMTFKQLAAIDPALEAGFECKIDEQGRDCFARNELCPQIGGVAGRRWCPLTTKLFMERAAQRWDK